MDFKLKSKFKPAGDQPQAIKKLISGLKKGNQHQTLLGVTGSGKTFTMANVIEHEQRPTLVIAHNKTLAAQLCNEFRQFFPGNAVEYFVSYYDYYQPEAYLPRSDTYIEKEAQINDEIDRLRHAATQSLLSRRDVIIVASVSCIYGLGAPEAYEKSIIQLTVGQEVSREDILQQLIDLQFERTNVDLKRGFFRVRGETIEVMPVNQELIYRIVVEKGRVADLRLLDHVTRRVRERVNEICIFPAKHFITRGPERKQAITKIRNEMTERLAQFDKEGKLLEAERLSRRTRYDLEMLANLGYCNGIENYSRHLSGRAPGKPPETLFSYFPDDFLLIIDESHVTVPQIRGMYNGDRARKKNLIEFGFRLPSAYDNRPMKFAEFEKKINQVIYTSATPGPYEEDHSQQVAEQIIRPTGLVDPKIIVRSVTETKKTKGQIDDLINEVGKRVKKKERVLVTTLTKKMAEDLSEFFDEQGVKVKYLHSGIDTLKRITILTEFRKGAFDVLVGVNLLREGLDLPEVTLVAILDADKEGFLRSETSLIQTIGRAARNVRGQVILYADQLTGSLKKAIGETERRRKKQIAYNKKHGITPQTIKKQIQDIRPTVEAEEKDISDILDIELRAEPHEIKKVIKEKEVEMKEAARNLQFELAAILRDEIKVLSQEIKK